MILSVSKAEQTQYLKLGFNRVYIDGVLPNTELKCRWSKVFLLVVHKQALMLSNEPVLYLYVYKTTLYGDDNYITGVGWIEYRIGLKEKQLINKSASTTTRPEQLKYSYGARK